MVDMTLKRRLCKGQGQFAYDFLYVVNIVTFAV